MNTNETQQDEAQRDRERDPSCDGFFCAECGETKDACVCCIVCHFTPCTCEEALAERIAEESRRDEWVAEASQGERAQLAWGGGL